MGSFSDLDQTSEMCVYIAGMIKQLQRVNRREFVQIKQKYSYSKPHLTFKHKNTF